jgi:hypothetical protein
MAAVSAVLAAVSAIEMLGPGKGPLTGLPLTALRKALGAPIAAIAIFAAVIIGSVLLLLAGSAVLHVFARIAKKKYADAVPAIPCT